MWEIYENDYEDGRFICLVSEKETAEAIVEYMKSMANSHGFIVYGEGGYEVGEINIRYKELYQESLLKPVPEWED